MPRKPNAICDQCGSGFYRRPSQSAKYKNSYCSKECYGKSKLSPDRVCAKCEGKFHPNRITQRFCSVRCASSVPKPRHGRYKGVRDKRGRRLAELKEAFDFNCCMVEGCEYSRTYDIHRVVQGKDGGKYEIGNMFAICPDQHAEFHRKLVILEKVNDCTLRAIYLDEEGQANVEVSAVSKAVRR